MNDSILSNIFDALSIAVMECLNDGSFRVMGTVPHWFKTLFPEAASGKEGVRLGKQFSFLHNFLIDAEDFWRSEATGRLRSGPWIETDTSGQDCALEASALSVGETKILLIESSQYAFAEKQFVIQTGRQLGLDYHHLQRLEEALERLNLELEDRVEKRTAELSRANRLLKREIAERKQAEEALRESEKKYRTLLEASPDPMVAYDMKGRVVYLNPAFTAVFGWTLDELVGKETGYVPEESWPETQTMIERVLAGESVSALESRRYTKQGDVLDVSVSVATYVNREGVPVGSVHTLRDITERKQLEAQLQHAAKMQAIGTLAGGIAHDFNNLLMGIEGRASLMLMDVDFDHSHFAHLRGIEEMVDRGSALSKQLLGLAKGTKYEVTPTDLNHLVERSSEMFGRTRKQIRIQRKYQKGLWTVEVDQGQMEQVLLNLYVNAWQAMPTGGDLTLETSNLVLDQQDTKPFSVQPGNYVKISVTDTGVGMDEATRQRVFEPFFTTKEMGGGTGLGLASAHGIIKNHGGIINVYSELDHGTTFDIYLPASEEEVTRGRAPSVEVLEGTETVLLIDDEAMILEVGKEMLTVLGYKVIVARNGKEAVDLYQENQEKIDMVILDMIMPDMGGGEVYNMLKEINPEIKVLLSSGYSIDGQADEILQRGGDGFIQKPFNVKQLSSQLRQILDNQ